jgi:hypothetical protein
VVPLQLEGVIRNTKEKGGGADERVCDRPFLFEKKINLKIKVA